MPAHLHTHTHTHANTHMCTHTHAYTYTRMHTHTHPPTHPPTPHTPHTLPLESEIEIIRQPEDVSSHVGEKITLYCKARSTRYRDKKLVYQWFEERGG